ncbi:hypothetical protein [Aquimarina muelleri]|uniref:Uncharacterized protein n=1 Tax=Aquimarina muelleri TaxID=279356 RepID=A0A918N2R0_9FLAO|nr:hypothetical protein [Aquimarina muelleri]MCX2761513.1 hypothetical protein [Aquimarina muelleri]GGX14268.1 hypothetical protein GCM10007384_14860 [Aquimarina muelleri]
MENAITQNILIRVSLSDDGTTPRTGDLSNSPDVIPFGTEKAEDPVSFFIGNYDENVNTDLEATKQNYIYMRGKDLVTGIQKGDMYMYYAKDTDLNTPRKWADNMLKTSANSYFNAVLGQSEGSILVGQNPYLWTPPSRDSGTAYNLIGVVVPSGKTPDFTGVTDFEKYVANNINVGWTKVTINNPTPPPIPELRWKTTFAYNQGDTAREMSFELNCKNIPIGTYISFSSDNPTGPNPVITLDKTKVSDPNGSFGIKSSVPAEYSGNITFSFFSNDAPPADSSITFLAYYLDRTETGPQKPKIVASVTTTN